MAAERVTCSDCGMELPDGSRDPCPRCGSTRRTFEVSIHEQARAVTTASIEVKRGPESWGWFYLVLGFALQIEATLIAMLPLQWWGNVLIAIAMFVLTFCLFLGSHRFQDVMVRVKNRIEAAQKVQ